jgi:DNA repair protein RecO (recombination protein O)
MDWRDEAVIIGMARHGESAVVLEAFTLGHGRHKGYVYGASSAKRRGMIQPGNRVAIAWRGRLAESLGTFTLELLSPFAAAVMAEPGPLAALRSLCAMLVRALPEQDPHPGLYAAVVAVLETLAAAPPDDPLWAAAAARFECRLLAELGYGLDLAHCAVTGATEGLAFVSPKTGRAVTVEGAGQFRDRLLPLPPFLTGAPAGWREIAEGFALTGHFLDRFFTEHDGRPMPAEREHLLSLIAQKAARYGGAS